MQMTGQQLGISTSFSPRDKPKLLCNIMTINIARTPVGSLKQIYLLQSKICKNRILANNKNGTSTHVVVLHATVQRMCSCKVKKNKLQQIIYKRTELSLQPHYLHNKGYSENVIAPMIWKGTHSHQVLWLNHVWLQLAIWECVLKWHQQQRGELLSQNL